MRPARAPRQERAAYHAPTSCGITLQPLDLASVFLVPTTCLEEIEGSTESLLLACAWCRCPDVRTSPLLSLKTKSGVRDRAKTVYQQRSNPCWCCARISSLDHNRPNRAYCLRCRSLGQVTTYTTSSRSQAGPFHQLTPTRKATFSSTSPTVALLLGLHGSS